MKTDNLNIQLNNIDLFNIFELMGLNHLPDSEKIHYMDKINSLFLREFLLKKMSLSKNPKDLIDLQEKIEDGIEFSRVMQIACQQNPNILNDLISFVRKEKSSIIVKYLTNLINQYKQIIDVATDYKQKVDSHKKLLFYQVALSFAMLEKWSDLHHYFITYPPYKQ